MLPFKKVLFPVDYSEPCCAVIPYVKEMARHFSAEVTLVHAYPSILQPYRDIMADPALPAANYRFEEARLTAFAKDAFPAQHVETHLESGEAGSVVRKIVQRQGTDLVMMGTHGYGPARRFLLGSLTAKVLHDVNAAVWTSAGVSVADHAPSPHYKCILCALDESDEGEAVLTAAAALADSYHARLALVHVLEMPVSSVAFDFSPGEKEIREDADFRIRELKGRLGIDAPHSLVEGSVAEAIQQEAIRRSADLIVTGRGLEQGAISRLWSRLYPIIRESPCPVLSI